MLAYTVTTDDVYAAIEANPNHMDIICALIKTTPADLLMKSTRLDLSDVSADLSIYGTKLLKQYVQDSELSDEVINKYPRALMTAALDVYCEPLFESEAVRWEKKLTKLLKSCSAHRDLVQVSLKKIAKSGLTSAGKGMRLTFLAEYI